MNGSHVEEFEAALKIYAPRYGVQIDSRAAKSLCDYYALIRVWNPRLHLVAPCSPADFATRHILESLTLLKHLPPDARVTDVGSGAGLPIIPCLIMRPDIKATLIEASAKKSVFLREALRSANRGSAANVIAERFENISPPAAEFVTCRALDRFTAMFSKLVEWSASAQGARTLLFFGGTSLALQIEKSALAYNAVRLPETEQRFLFVIELNA